MLEFLLVRLTALARLLPLMLVPDSAAYSAHAAACLALGTRADLNLTFSTTISSATYLRAGSRVKPQGTCLGPTDRVRVSADVCRVQFVVHTTNVSAVTAETWLPRPDQWEGRFLALGNSGIGGCIDYDRLQYGASLQFATVGSNNGHDGNDGRVFLDAPEVLTDFASRSVHVSTVISKQLLSAYYTRPHSKSYYLGCSTGGRQGTYAALHHPDDFDGIVAGAPATDNNHLVHWVGMLTRWAGAPDGPASPAFISTEQWGAVTAEIMRQCDALDGVVDGIVTEPDACRFRPEALLCSDGNSNCLSLEQVKVLRKIYAPLYADDELVYPRFDPGAEASPLVRWVFNGDFFIFTEHWFKYTVANTTEYDFHKYGRKELDLMDAVNPGGISTFEGDFSAFRDRGGKFLTYHGRMDPLIASGNSKRMYDLIAQTMSMSSLDSFYRLFLVPGMDHCEGGTPNAASRFGQGGLASNAKNDARHNVLWAVVDWVENGVAPDIITGTTPDGQAERDHCRYPQRSVWDGQVFRCE
ncbi:unnamed protein product [Mycena citricolor]|uniref:Carboxylic ester hydrolase n=1 Tax=Mycena citricolor TaxID=2018698 RepID=A0AAD2H902_9AGAR|nr:unnamed protein product [Mycena citricolor]